jgi:predicted MFS family arabinose efflux permease
MIGILMLGGFFRSLQFTSINALAYAEVPTSRMSRATALAAVGQQVSLATGVAVGALTVEIVVRLKEQPPSWRRIFRRASCWSAYRAVRP